MLILKSASPRRKEILSNLGLDFEVSPSDIDEEILPGEQPLEYLRRVTIAKINSPENFDTNIYVSSDTIVVKNDKIYPKPLRREVCLENLKELNNTIHSVYSGLAIYSEGKIIYEYDESIIKFKNWSLDEMNDYIENFNPLDKAGGYGIQDEAGPVKNLTGSYSNVMGFPLRKFFKYKEIW
ncbi:MAG: septum formation protein Maf, partial [Leptospiraceae bacterium]|nr:septum formation protein Maf [Leptospiraceae bacterium]